METHTQKRRPRMEKKKEEAPRHAPACTPDVLTHARAPRPAPACAHNALTLARARVPLARARVRGGVHQPSVILVTGGSGLVGRAIAHVIEHSDDPRFRKRDGETWIFLTSKDGDLRYVAARPGCSQQHLWGRDVT